MHVYVHVYVLCGCVCVCACMQMCPHVCPDAITSHLRYKATLDSIKNDSGFNRVVKAVTTINAHVEKQVSHILMRGSLQSFSFFLSFVFLFSHINGRSARAVDRNQL